MLIFMKLKKLLEMQLNECIAEGTEVTGQKSYKEFESEKTRGKKRYIERKIEEEEAEQEIEDFDIEQLDFPENKDNNHGAY